MISSIDLSRLRNGEYAQFLQDFLAFVAKNDPAALKVTDAYNNLKNKEAEIEALFKTPAGNILTAELEQLDTRRDQALSGMRSIANGHTYNTDATLRKHADALIANINSYGNNIINDSYQSETATIRNLIVDWDAQPVLTAAIGALGLAGWRTELEEANIRFSESYLQRAEDTGLADASSISTKRIAANDAYYKLRDLINAYYTIAGGEEPYKKMVASANGLIDYYNSLLDRRVAPPKAKAVSKDASAPDAAA